MSSLSAQDSKSGGGSGAHYQTQKREGCLIVGTTNFSDLESENLNYNTSREYLYVGKAYLSI